ncbi:DUF4235 domain-containing protein [Sinomonas sp. JGH33]|uniref:DUF4235 domain-containing protein n=1 Tax=Sinomonas terricola TaxID=3110330 RepID=A0ABU5TDQ9_9MICC|nr:DUF4235 domain-containing protein [Sinomonas sp. JGH33]MEA5457221.1 DUF4235 domain-containing protein [Sinomonas sp. JGH33]
MTILIKLFGTAISLGAGFAATKVVDAVWEKSTGNKPPKDATNIEQSLRDTLVFALVSASVGATIQVLTQRFTQKAIARFNSTPDAV